MVMGDMSIFLLLQVCDDVSRLKKVMVIIFKKMQQISNHE
jgi:hypothetical protein